MSFYLILDIEWRYTFGQVAPSCYKLRQSGWEKPNKTSYWCYQVFLLRAIRMDYQCHLNGIYRKWIIMVKQIFQNILHTSLYQFSIDLVPLWHFKFVLMWVDRLELNLFSSGLNASEIWCGQQPMCQVNVNCIFPTKTILLFKRSGYDTWILTTCMYQNFNSSQLFRAKIWNFFKRCDIFACTYPHYQKYKQSLVTNEWTGVVDFCFVIWILEKPYQQAQEYHHQYFCHINGILLTTDDYFVFVVELNLSSQEKLNLEKNQF